MPTYVYKREDGSTFELEQRITEDAIQVCPTTGQKVKRVISGSAGLVFKGSGFYLTDYGKSSSSASSSNGSSDSPESKSNKSTSDSSSEKGSSEKGSSEKTSSEKSSTSTSSTKDG